MTKRGEINLPGIYTITHVVSQRVYVGQTINFRVRWMCHKRDLRLNKHRNVHLQNAWNKHGEDAFVFCIHLDMSATPPAELANALNEAEIDLVSSLSKTFNLMLAGLSGLVPGPETRAILSKINKARWSDPDFRKRRSDETKALYKNVEWKSKRDAAVKEGKGQPHARAAVSEQFLNFWNDQEHRDAQSRRHTAHWQDPEYIARQSESRKASWADPESRSRRVASLKEASSRPEVMEARKRGLLVVRKQISASFKARWQDPEFRTRMVASQKEGRARKKAEDPG